MRTFKRAAMLAVVLAVAGAVAAVVATGSSARPAALPLPHPTLDSFQLVSTGTTPPTEAQCEAQAAGFRTCFGPQAIQSAYNLGPLYAQGLDGHGMTIAIVDAQGSDTMRHDLHVFDQAFGLQPMCGEEGVTCTSGMPTFSELDLQGSPPTTPQPGNGTHLMDHTVWAIEVALDVETAHAIAPGANILLVHTPEAETLGLQGFPQMMMAEDYVVKHHLANVISQSFASAEEAFGSTQSLLNLRFAYQDAAANGVTVLGSSGDFGTANENKNDLIGNPNTGPSGIIPFPTVEWPASDPLVTGVGGTYLCTDPLASTNDPRTIYAKAGVGAKCSSSSVFNPGGINAEVAWTFSGGGFSHIFSTPSYQNNLPAGSTPIGSMRGVPDVAFQASSATGALIYLSLPPDGNSSNVSDSTTGWYDIGGTSLACPQWAGLVAIADQINGGGLGLINPALYKIGADATRYANDFFDIATGNTNKTSNDPNVAGYPSTTGWDPVTGLGTPNAANLVPDLVAAANGN